MAIATPLSDLLTARGAEFGDESGHIVPISFGDPALEVRAAHSGAVLADVSHWCHFTLRGADSVKFLQGLVTNDVAALKPGAGCQAAILNVHGRFEAVCSIFCFDDGMLIQTPPGAADYVEKFLGRYRLAGDFQFDRVRDAVAVTIQGPAAPEVFATAFSAKAGEDGQSWCADVSLDSHRVRALGVQRSEDGGFDLVGPAGEIAAIVEHLLDSATVKPVLAGSEALETLRIEAGIPRYLKDFDSDTVLQEIDVPEIVSFHKGCYLGQEIVARIHFQGQPSKLLRRIEIDGSVPPEPGADLIAGDDDKVVGRITSIVVSPVRGLIVFAVVKRRYYAPGTRIRVRNVAAILDATVVERAHAGRVTQTV